MAVVVGDDLEVVEIGVVVVLTMFVQEAGTAGAVALPAATEAAEETARGGAEAVAR